MCLVLRDANIHAVVVRLSNAGLNFDGGGRFTRGERFDRCSSRDLRGVIKQPHLDCRINVLRLSVDYYDFDLVDVEPGAVGSGFGG
ncbi:MAG: hypothetical protein ACI9CA_001553 [Natronomonas sp.]